MESGKGETSHPQKKLEPNMAFDFIAGGVGGCAGLIVGHPFDTVKVKLQTQDCRNPVYKGMWDCFVKILKTESVVGVYRGVSSPMASISLVNAIVFGVYGNVLRKMSAPESLWSQFMAGGMAGLVQSVVTSPVELVKTRMQTSKQYQGTIDCIMKTFKQEGVQGLFKGLGITGGRDFLGYGVYFAAYEAMTLTSPDDMPVGTVNMLLAGGTSGTLAWLTTFPLDVIKTRLQADVGLYSSITDCMRKSIREEGLIFLTRGLTPTLIRAFPTNAVTFTVVTWVSRLLESFQKSRSVKDTANSVLEVPPKQKCNLRSLDMREESIKASDLTWLSRTQFQRRFLLTKDYSSNDESNYFEDFKNTNLFKNENNFEDNNADVQPTIADKSGFFVVQKKIIISDLTNEINNLNEQPNKELR